MNERVFMAGLPKTGLADVLRADHARLEIVYDRFLDAYRGGAWPAVEAEWEIFERELRLHMEFEETRVFPMFRDVDAEAHESLVAEHAKFRERLSALGLLVELHAVPRADAEDLVAQLRAHRAREERVLYPWIEATDMPAPTVRCHGGTGAAF